MKITILGGSPKGDVSVTMQYVKFLQTNFPEHGFVFHQPAHEIVRLEKHPEAFDAVISDVRSSDLILWAFPLYVFTVCSQYQRFIELITERGVRDAFQGKQAASFSTSIRFFDHTAHRHMRAHFDDLGMRFAGGYSASMNDLLQKKMQQQIVLFFEGVIKNVETGDECIREYPVLPAKSADYRSSTAIGKKVNSLKKITIITDGSGGNLSAMIDRLSGSFETTPDIVDLQKLDIKGGCLGCLKCGQANHCAYEGKDAFISTYEKRIKTADIVVMAAVMKGRALSSRFKLFLDRSFYNTHQQVLKGKQLAFLISGPLGYSEYLREILTGLAEWQGTNLVGIITDEQPELLDRVIDTLAETLVRSSEAGVIKPATFLGYAGMKVFRDDIYGQLRVVFKADHRSYRKSGVYDFPQNNFFIMGFLRLLYLVTSIPWVYRKMISNFKQFMLMPYRNIVRTVIRK